MATRIEGLDRLRKKLRRFPEAARAEIAKAMEQTAKEVVALAKGLVPVGTGNLRNSIGWTWGEAPAGSMTLGEVRGGQGNLRIVIFAGDESTLVPGARVYFQLARLVEFGTQNMRAQPYFFVSWRALRRRARGRVTRAITKSAKRVAAGG